MATEVIKTDVVICGSGSAGVCAAVSLAQGGIRFRMLESRDGPLERGQADGVQCRTVEIFDSFDVSAELLRQAYHVNELTFWAMDETSGELVRTSRAPDTPIGISCQPHVILNQARLIKILLDKMREFAPEQDVDYDTSVLGVRYDHEGADPNYPIEVRAIQGGKAKIFDAKYVLACDGSHSSVRRSLGIQMVGDSSDAVWGVMDIFPRTNFPDIRKKATIHTDNGALVIIPREGGQMVRFYLQMPAGTNSKAVTLDNLHARAAAILHGYDFEVADTFWWSAYTIGQRVASAFTAGHGRIILTGDSCHTHSPKAGQGMNVSLQDGYNVAWKLSHVLSGRLPPSALHETYILEREKVARDLIDFDRRLTQFYAESDNDKQGVKFKEHFIKSAKYMAGLTSRYEESCLTNYTSSEQEAATQVLVGMRFPSAKVIRHCDVKEMQFQKALPSDGRWKIVVFIGDLQKSECAQNLQDVTRFFESTASPLRKARKSHPDEHIELLLVIAGNRTAIELHDIPSIFRPVTGNLQMQDINKIYVDDVGYSGEHGHAYDAFGIDAHRGAIIVVRPDQHVSLVVRPNNVQAVGRFFDNISVDGGNGNVEANGKP